MTRIFLENHPMKRAAMDILRKHFSESIAKRFIFQFEAEIYDSVNIHNQIKDDKLIMEVWYKEADDSTEYICDVFNWMTTSQLEYKLLRYISDAYRAGKIGKRWKELKGKLVNSDIIEGKHETPDELQNN